MVVSKTWRDFQFACACAAASCTAQHARQQATHLTPPPTAAMPIHKLTHDLIAMVETEYKDLKSLRLAHNGSNNMHHQHLLSCVLKQFGSHFLPLITTEIRSIDDVFAPLASRLLSLDLANNYISEAQHLEKLTNLQHLSLAHNNL